jgi:hypothetical protein
MAGKSILTWTIKVSERAWIARDGHHVIMNPT